jgi:hypothetical protein
MAYTFDPKSVSVVLGGKVISGWDDGEFISVERNNDMWALKMGADGVGARAKTNDKSGRVTMTLLQSSPSNDVLSAFAIADEASNAGAVPLLIRDGSGRTLVSALTAWVVKMPAAAFAKEVGNRQWIVESDSLQIFIGGN